MENNNKSIREIVNISNTTLITLSKKIDILSDKLGDTREEFINEIGKLRQSIAVLKIKHGILAGLLGVFGGFVPVVIIFVLHLLK